MALEPRQYADVCILVCQFLGLDSAVKPRRTSSGTSFSADTLKIGQERQCLTKSLCINTFCLFWKRFGLIYFISSRNASEMSGSNKCKSAVTRGLA